MDLPKRNPTTTWMIRGWGSAKVCSMGCVCAFCEWFGGGTFRDKEETPPKRRVGEMICLSYAWRVRGNEEWRPLSSEHGSCEKDKQNEVTQMGFRGVVGLETGYRVWVQGPAERVFQISPVELVITRYWSILQPFNYVFQTGVDVSGGVGKVERYAWDRGAVSPPPGGPSKLEL